MHIAVVSPHQSTSEQLRESVEQSVRAALAEVAAQVREVRVTMRKAITPSYSVGIRWIVRISLLPRGTLVISSQHGNGKRALASALRNARDKISRRSHFRRRKAHPTS